MINKMTSESAVVGFKDSNFKISRTDAFQSIMNIAQNISAKIETTTSTKNHVEEVATKVTAKDMISEKLKLANQALKTKDNLEEENSQLEDLMGQLIVSIKQEVLNSLGVTEEELAATMESLGLNDIDLLSSVNITDLTVYMMTGEEESLELLFNPEFAEILKELQANIKELQAEVLTELNVTEKEFTNLVKQMIGDSQKTAGTILAENLADHVESISNTTTSNKTTEQTVVTIETEDSNEENLANGNQNQTANIVTNLEVVLETLTDEVEASSIVKQIADEFQVNVKQGVTSMELQLNPEDLGKIHLELVSKNGVITASITAETQMAKEAIESQMIVLKENLINQGVKVEEIEVTIATHQFEQNLDGHKEKEEETHSGKRKLNLNELDLETLEPQDILEQSIMISNGNSVNLIA